MNKIVNKQTDMIVVSCFSFDFKSFLTLLRTFFANWMIFILEEDVEYYKHDKNMPIYGYTVPDLPTILQICFNGDVFPTVVA